MVNKWTLRARDAVRIWAFPKDIRGVGGAVSIISYYGGETVAGLFLTLQSRDLRGRPKLNATTHLVYDYAQ
eukprot:15140-Pyramimonas_sp.AAC.1